MESNYLEVRNKKYGLQLANMGYELIDLKPYNDRVHCIFAYSDEALNDIRKEIDKLKSGKVSKENAVTKNDIGNLLNKVKGYR